VEEYSKTIGSGYSRFDPKEILEQRVGSKLDWTEIDKDRRNYYQSLILEKEALPGIRRLVQEIKSNLLQCAIASSSPASWVDGHLKRLYQSAFKMLRIAPSTHPSPRWGEKVSVGRMRGSSCRFEGNSVLGLREHFDFLSCADLPARPKPDPCVYLKALEMLEVPASKAIAIEDSPNGAMAALAAGIYCIGVPNSITATLTFPAECKLVGDLEDISLNVLMDFHRAAHGEQNRPTISRGAV
jgi:beta-phosphoglucomutase-like phosphatase (HAD superfamily)